MSIKIIKINEAVLGANENQAELNKKLLDEKKVFTVNVLAAPGAGKTSTIIRAANALKGKFGIGIIEGDAASSLDASRIHAVRIPVVQLNTSGSTFLNAGMVLPALQSLPLDDIDLLFIENMGNLVYPDSFKLGEDSRILISSTPEGDDKPYKYPSLFTDTDIVLLNKMDLGPYLNFKIENFKKGVLEINPEAVIYPCSCTTGNGIDTWVEWLEASVLTKKNA